MASGIGAALLATPVLATEERRPRIPVSSGSGSGVVSTPRDMATIDYLVWLAKAGRATMRSAGWSPDAGASPPDWPRSRADATADDIAIKAVRGEDCRRERGEDDAQPRLSTGACAITGYVAAVDMSLRTAAVADAGTIVGLLGRLEASDPHLGGFSLADPQAADRRAIAAALVDARCRAEAIVAGTGVKLGRLTAASTGNDGFLPASDVVVTRSRIAPAILSPPPVVVDLAPRAVETRAQVRDRTLTRAHPSPSIASIASASSTSRWLSPPASWVVSRMSTRFHTLRHSG